MHRRRLALFALVATLGLAGCELTPDLNDPVRYGPFYAPKNYSGVEKLPAEIRRVLVLPVSVGDLAPEETATMLDGAITRALNAQQRFEVVTFSRADSTRIFGQPEFASTAALPHGMLEQLAARYAVDAVLFTDLTVYKPYRPQAVGLRSKLATVRDVRILWTFDEIVSGADPSVANSARRAALPAQGRAPLDMSPATLISPSRFAAFAADAMFQTMPRR